MKQVVYLLIPTSNHNSLPACALKRLVVYLLIPTSNHNLTVLSRAEYNVVYLLIPTSNHNQLWVLDELASVVYLLIPTSNHNYHLERMLTTPLYIFWFLHQTTTAGVSLNVVNCCISFDSYIKPQPGGAKYVSKYGCISFDSYIKPQLS